MAKTEQIILRCEPELKEQMKKAAAEDGRSVTNYVERLVANDLTARSKEKEKGSATMTITNEEIRAAAAIFAACYKATGSRNQTDITNAQMFPFRGVTLYTQKLHTVCKTSPELERYIAEQFDQISLETFQGAFEQCLTLPQQGTWMLAFSKCLNAPDNGKG